MYFSKTVAFKRKRKKRISAFVAFQKTNNNARRKRSMFTATQI